MINNKDSNQGAWKMKIKVDAGHCWEKFACGEKAIQYAKDVEENGWGVPRFYYLDDETGMWEEVTKEQIA